MIKWVGFKQDIFFLLFLLLTLPLFFYKLGQSSLVSWDEAWYADIARNILESGDLLHLNFNGNPYTDHPAFGFWLVAITFKIFGVNEYWARFPQAASGFLGIIFIYLLGRDMFGRVVGICASLALASSPWFIFRARSGNLDALLTTLFIIVFYFAFKARDNKSFLLPFFLSLSALFLTKTLVPFTVVPALLIIFWKSKLKASDFAFPLIVFILITGLFFKSQIAYKSDYLNRYFMIGYPGASTQSNLVDNLKLFKEYLHSGIGKWFWPGVGSVALGIFLRKRIFFAFFIFFITFAVPFLFSPKGQIWHLLPLHPVLVLSFFGFTSVILNSVHDLFQKIHWLPKQVRHDKKRIITTAIILGIAFYYSFIQIRQSWYQFIDIPRYISDEAILSKEAGKYEHDFYIDGGDFGPAAAFYSEKQVSKVWEGGLKELFDQDEPFVLITHQWRLDKYEIPKESYKILKSDRDKILVIRKNP